MAKLEIGQASAAPAVATGTFAVPRPATAHGPPPSPETAPRDPPRRPPACQKFSRGFQCTRPWLCLASAAPTTPKGAGGEAKAAKTSGRPPGRHGGGGRQRCGPPDRPKRQASTASVSRVPGGPGRARHRSSAAVTPGPGGDSPKGRLQLGPAHARPVIPSNSVQVVVIFFLCRFFCFHF